MSGVFINGRFLKQAITGVQRYARGVIDHLVIPCTTVTNPAEGKVASLMWEHYILPRHLREKGSPLLLNLCNTAPHSYANQVVTIHDMAIFRRPQWFNPVFVRYYKWLLPRIAQTSRHIVTVSEFSKGEIVHFLGIPPEKITVIHGAAHPSLLNATPMRPIMPDERPFLLMVGSRDPRKNMDMVVKHVTPVLEEFDYNLIIAGRSSWTFAPPPRRSSDRLVWMDGVTDAELKWLYSHAVLCIQPSLYEGFSIVPLESLALNTPVLVSDIPAHREVLGEAAVRFDPGNPEDFLRCLRQNLENPRNHGKAAGEEFTYTKAAQQWRTLIDRYAQ